MDKACDIGPTSRRFPFFYNFFNILSAMNSTHHYEENPTVKCILLTNKLPGT